MNPLVTLKITNSFVPRPNCDKITGVFPTCSLDFHKNIPRITFPSRNNFYFKAVLNIKFTFTLTFFQLSVCKVNNLKLFQQFYKFDFQFLFDFLNSYSENDVTI